MTDAFTGVGAEFQRGDGASSETFSAIAEVASITGPNLTRDVVDATNLSSTGGYREFISGFRDGGEVSIELNFTLDGYDDLKIDLESDSSHNYKIVLPDTGETTFEFTAFITALGVAVPAGDKVTATATFKITGQVTLSS